MIQISNLSKRFGTNQVLTDLSITFKAGQVYGIVGENGAGKTTLFRCIAGLEKYEGNIFSSVTPLKNHLGLLVTEPFYFSKMTGKEYIQLLLNARQKNIPKIEAKNIFELPLNQYVSTYSTGMKKKLAITAVLLQENQYLIFDEPFNGVDIQSNIIITEIILRLRQLGKTVIISSHIFSTLSDTCDEIHLLKNGKFVKAVKADNFGELESEMKEVSVGNRIANLELK